MACLASLGLVASMIYSLRIVQKVFFEKEVTKWKIPDLSIREKLVFASLVISIFYIGLTPQKVIDVAEPALTGILNSAIKDKNIITKDVNDQVIKNNKTYKYSPNVQSRK